MEFSVTIKPPGTDLVSSPAGEWFHGELAGSRRAAHPFRSTQTQEARPLMGRAS
jgi:hypothetical protein